MIFSVRRQSPKLLFQNQKKKKGEKKSLCKGHPSQAGRLGSHALWKWWGNATCLARVCLLRSPWPRNEPRQSLKELCQSRKQGGQTKTPENKRFGFEPSSLFTSYVMLVEPSLISQVLDSSSIKWKRNLAQSKQHTCISSCSFIVQNLKGKVMLVYYEPMGRPCLNFIGASKAGPGSNSGSHVALPWLFALLQSGWFLRLDLLQPWHFFYNHKGFIYNNLKLATSNDRTDQSFWRMSLTLVGSLFWMTELV